MCLDRGAVAEGGVQPSAVVEHLDVFGDGEPGACPGRERLPVIAGGSTVPAGVSTIKRSPMLAGYEDFYSLGSGFIEVLPLAGAAGLTVVAGSSP